MKVALLLINMDDPLPIMPQSPPKRFLRRERKPILPRLLLSSHLLIMLFARLTELPRGGAHHFGRLVEGRELEVVEHAAVDLGHACVADGAAAASQGGGGGAEVTVAAVAVPGRDLRFPDGEEAAVIFAGYRFRYLRLYLHFLMPASEIDMDMLGYGGRSMTSDARHDCLRLFIRVHGARGLKVVGERR